MVLLSFRNYNIFRNLTRFNLIQFNLIIIIINLYNFNTYFFKISAPVILIYTILPDHLNCGGRNIPFSLSVKYSLALDSFESR